MQASIGSAALRPAAGRPKAPIAVRCLRLPVRAAAAAPAVTEQRARALPSIPVWQVDAGVREALERDLGAQLSGVRWDEEPDRFDDIAFACLRQHLLTDELLAELRGMLDDPARPVALLLQGLPQDANLPANPQKPPVEKEGQMVEAMLTGFSRIWGRATGYPGQGPAGITRDLIAVQSTMFSSSTELAMHRDFGIVPEGKVPDVRLIYCIRPDKRREVETLVADNRDVVAVMDPADVALLRAVPLTIGGNGITQTKCMLQGPEELPALSLFDMAVFNGGGTIEAEDPAAIDAYHWAFDAAMGVAAGVRLQEGDLLLINNNRAVHARTQSPHEADGLGRWLKVTFAKAGAGPGEGRYLQL